MDALLWILFLYYFVNIMALDLVLFCFVWELEVKFYLGQNEEQWH